MKLTKSQAAVLSSILVIGFASSAQSQIYPVSMPLQVIPLPIADSNNHLLELPIMSSTLTGSTIINAGGPTIEQTGSFALAASSVSGTFNETRMVTLPPVFPNPPQTITLTGSLTLTVEFAGGEFSFDTGARPLTYSSPNNYSFDSSASVVLPIDFSYSLVTGGQTYTGSSDINLTLMLNDSGAINTANYPTAIDLVSSPSLANGNGSAVVVGSIAAANGFNSEIEVTPEPSTIALGAAGLLAMLLCRRRK